MKAKIGFCFFAIELMITMAWAGQPSQTTTAEILALVGEIFVDYQVTDCTSYDPVTRACGTGSDRAFSLLTDAVAAATIGDSIVLRAGTYRLTQPLQLGPATVDNITLRSFFGEDARVSGGQRISGEWQAYDGNIYVIDVTNHQNQYGGFNTLFVEGQRAVRAREPDQGFYLIAGVYPATNLDAFQFSGADINGAWSNLQQVEVVSYRRWIQSRFAIDAVVGNTVSFQGSLPSGRGYDWDYTAGTGRYFVENVFEGLDTPGEWYLDKNLGKLYYWPLPGENINSIEVVAPILQQLISIRGSENQLPLTTSFTISHWIRTTSSQTQMYSVGNAGGGNGYRFGLSNGRIAFLIGSGSEFTESPCGPAVNDDNWHLITGIYDRSANRFLCYVDGQFNQSVVLQHDYSTMQTSLPGVGAPPCCKSLIGTMDDLRIFGRILTASEVAALYNWSDVTDALLLHLQFDGTLVDNSGQLNNIQLNQTPQFVSTPFGGQALEFDGTTSLTFSKLKSWAENIHISALTFEHSDWFLPQGYAGSQAASSAPAQAAIELEYVRNSSFSNNSVRHTGFYGMRVIGDNIDISNNEFTANGAGSVWLGACRTYRQRCTYRETK